MARTLRHKKGVVTNMVGAELFSRKAQDRPRYVYEFDGATMYATIPDWTPKGLPFSVEASAVPLTIDGTERRIWSSGATGNPNGRIQANSQWAGRLERASDGVAVNSAVALPLAVVGTAYNTIFNGTSTKSVFTANGVDGNAQGAPVSVTGDPTNAIAGTSLNALNFHGPIWDVTLTDNSPIQNTDAVKGNDTRYGVIPQIDGLAEDSFLITFDWIRLDRTGTGNIDIISDGSADNAIRIADSGNATLPNGIFVRLTGGVVASIANVFEDVAQGQHCRVALGHDAENDLFYASVDGKAQKTAAAPGQKWLFNHICGRDGSGLGLITNQSVQNVEFYAQGKKWQFPLNEGEGTVIHNVDPETGSAGPELWENPAAVINAPWIYEGSGVYSIDGSQGGSTNLRGPNQVAGKRYLLRFEVFDYVAGSGQSVGSVGADNVVFNAAGWYEVVMTATDGSRIGVQAYASFNGKIRNFSVTNYPHGYWTPDAVWQNFPKRSRHYPMNEGSGTVIKNVLDDSGATDGTIVNGDNGSWGVK